MRRALLRLAAGLAGLLVLAAHVQGQPPAPTAAPERPYEVTGFRSARFGMAEADLRRAIAADFGPVKVMAVDQPAEGTRVLVAALPQLPPGPGGASVSYVLGARSARLMHVNVSWTSDAPGPAEREQFAVAALQLSRYFREHAWAAAAPVGQALGDGTMPAFAGRDAKGSGVELSVTGAGVAFGGAPPTGPARLRVSYSANAAQPDVARVRDPQF